MNLASTFRNIVLSLAVCCAAAGFAQGGNDPEAVNLLKKVEAKNGEVRSVSGSFSQTLTDPAFGETVDSQANFQMLKPSNFKVQYLAPKESLNLISGQTSYRYVPSLKQVERYQFKKANTARDLNYMLLGFGAKTEDVLSVYTVKSLPGGKGVKLVPRDKKEAPFKYIDVELNSDLLPKRFTMEQNDSAKMIVNLDTSSLQLNPSLSERDFRPNFPRDAKTVDMQ